MSNSSSNIYSFHYKLPMAPRQARTYPQGPASADFYRFDFATRSSSSFFCHQSNQLPPITLPPSLQLTLIAYELDDPLAALINSSARHSATDLTFRNALSRVWQGEYVSRSFPLTAQSMQQKPSHIYGSEAPNYEKTADEKQKSRILSTHPNSKQRNRLVHPPER
jgi:hypothetical protein